MICHIFFSFFWFCVCVRVYVFVVVVAGGAFYNCLKTQQTILGPLAIQKQGTGQSLPIPAFHPNQHVLRMYSPNKK